MQNFPFVNVSEGLAQLAEVAEDESFREGASPLTVDFVVQVASLAVLHHDEESSAI